MNPPALGIIQSSLFKSANFGGILQAIGKQSFIYQTPLLNLFLAHSLYNQDNTVPAVVLHCPACSTPEDTVLALVSVDHTLRGGSSPAGSWAWSWYRILLSLKGTCGLRGERAHVQQIYPWKITRFHRNYRCYKINLIQITCSLLNLNKNESFTIKHY